MRTWAIISVFLAIATSLWTWLPRHTVRAQTEREDGKLLTQSGEQVAPDRITTLRVVSWDKEDKAPQVFEVAKKNNQWVIPSHHDYPADGGSRVGETAGGVLNIPRGPLVTDKADKHADFGVVDPEKEGLTDEEGRGKRIKLMDEGGATLVDLIVGKRAPSGELYYVRPSDGDKVYSAKVNVDISTAFKDWVETDFLKVDRSKIQRLDVNDYSIDEKQGTLVPRSESVLEKAKNASEWTSPKTPETKKVSQSTIETLLTELTSVRLANVLPFHPDWLGQRGFHLQVNEKRQVVGVKGLEGDLRVISEDGLVHSIFFGRVSTGDDSEAAPKAGDGKKKEKKAEDKKASNRYVAVFVNYDPQQDRTPPKAGKKEEAKTGETKAEKKEEGPSPEQIQEGQKKAEEKQLRFLRFFYVISDESFKKLRPEVDKLFEDKELSKDKLPGEKVPAEMNLIKNPSGLQYVDLKAGTGDEAAEGDTVEVHYTGWLEKDGTKFDSSLDHEPKNPFPVTIGAGQVIKGWDEGLKGMKAGGKRKLVIPAELGYGKAGSPPKISAEARLTFDVELLKVTKKNAPPAEPQKGEGKPETPAPEPKKEEAKTPDPKAEIKTEPPAAKMEEAKTTVPAVKDQK